jgi:hypothetical protein
MSSITPDDARRYLERWKLVEEREIAELRNTPIEIKARQLAALMASQDCERLERGWCNASAHGPGLLSEQGCDQQSQLVLD